MKFIAVVISYTLFPIIEFLMGIHSNFPTCCVWGYVKDGSLNSNRWTESWWRFRDDNDYNCNYKPCNKCRKERRFVAKDTLINCDNCVSLYCKFLHKAHSVVIRYLYKHAVIPIPIFDVDDDGKLTFNGFYYQ